MSRFILSFWLMIMASLAVSTADAHEVRPAIADFRTENGMFFVDLEFDAEPIVAGVNLEGVEDTNTTDRAEDVDRLRALEPAALEQALRAELSGILSQIAVTANGATLTLDAVDIAIEPVGNTELPRATKMALEAALPPGTTTLDVVWPASFGTLILRQQGVEDPFTGYLTGGEPSGPIAVAGGDALSGWGTFAYYIPVGFDHIVPLGLDHILFVLGLFFLSTHLRPLLWQISAFTLAHTVTLALGALGYVQIPGSIVEPIIAASIVYVAIENIVSDKLHRWRPIVIFVFGLLHGLGFASVLGEFGLPDAQFVPALIGFNIGVELGQLAVILLAFGIVWYAMRVDRGRATIKLGQVVYVGLALTFAVAGFALAGPAFTEAMGAGAFVFFGPLIVLSLLCLASVTFTDQPNAYRRFVVVPSSLGIAAIGAYWFIERVFL